MHSISSSTPTVTKDYLTCLKKNPSDPVINYSFVDNEVGCARLVREKKKQTRTELENSPMDFYYFFSFPPIENNDDSK